MHSVVDMNLDMDLDQNMTWTWTWSLTISKLPKKAQGNLINDKNAKKRLQVT